MTTFRYSRYVALGLLATLPLAAFAQQPDADAARAAADAKMRDALRTSMLEARKTKAELTEALAALETKNVEVDALRKTAAADAKKNADAAQLAAKKLAELESRLTAKTREAEKLAAGLAEWRDTAGKAVELGNRTEAERVRLAALSDRLTVRLADREAKNVALITLSQEILKRFENYGLGRAIAGREAFTGLARVELQTLAQDYADKIADQKVIPGTPAPNETPAAQ